LDRKYLFFFYNLSTYLLKTDKKKLECYDNN
jgi:hypothetical protein